MDQWGQIFDFCRLDISMPASPGHITLRPLTEPDEGFSYRVYAHTRDEEMALLAWSPEQKSDFLQMQFNAQRTHYHLYSPEAEWSVIEVDGVPVGRLIVDRSAASHIQMMDIALLPEFRRQGIGEFLLRTLIDEAGAAGKTVGLHVEDFNPAARLYQRLGFRFTGARYGIYQEMVWP